MTAPRTPRDGDVILHCGAGDASFELETQGETSRVVFTDRHEAIRMARELARTRRRVLWFVDANGLRSCVAPFSH